MQLDSVNCDEMVWTDLFPILEPYKEIIELLLGIIIVFLVFTITLRILKKHLLKKVKRKKQASHVIAFFGVIKFLFIIFLVIIIIIAYYGNWGDVGFIAGLLTVALGMALQKPIGSVFAWLIIVTRRPFGVGDRVIISSIRGDVIDISLFHIYLEEVGGTIDGEEKSNRSVILPTSIIFDQEVINYNEKDEYILDEVTMAITYESNVDKAEKIMNDAVGKIMAPLWETFQKRLPLESHTRLKSKDSGIAVTVRYYTLVTKRNAISTDILREILKQISKTKDVEIAYPHTQVLLPENKKL
jgi:small-conductance mechanosensitive channel